MNADEERDTFNRWVNDGLPTTPKACPSCGDTLHRGTCRKCAMMNYESQREFDAALMAEVRRGIR
jgi:hypothetical protein